MNQDLLQHLKPVALLLVWLAAYWFGRRWVAGRRFLVLPLSLLAALCFTGFACTLYHHIWVAGPFDGLPWRLLVIYLFTLLGTACFTDLARRSWRVDKPYNAL